MIVYSACAMYNSPPSDAGWSSLAARRAHNPKVVGSNPAPATSFILVKKAYRSYVSIFYVCRVTCRSLY